MSKNSNTLLFWGAGSHLGDWEIAGVQFFFWVGEDPDCSVQDGCRRVVYGTYGWFLIFLNRMHKIFQVETKSP